MPTSVEINGKGNTRDWLSSDDKTRVAEVFYTNYGTKLYVKNGALTEEKLAVSSPPRILDSDDERWERDGISCRTPPSPNRMSSENGALTEETLAVSSPPRILDSDDERWERDGMSCRTPPSPNGMSSEEFKEAERSQTIGTAEAALKYYNKKHHTKYELVDPVVSNGCLFGDGIWLHCNFTAKPEISSESSQESVTKFYFAELKVAGHESGITKYSVTACRPLDGGKRTTPCDMCPGKILHPNRGFRKGLYEFKRRALRPRHRYDC